MLVMGQMASVNVPGDGEGEPVGRCSKADSPHPPGVHP